MSSMSVGIMHAQTTVDRIALVEQAGKEIVRWGLVVAITWIGGMKFTAYEAMGIQPLVAHSPLVGWMYDFLSVRSFSTMLVSSKSEPRCLSLCDPYPPRRQRLAVFSRWDCSQRRSPFSSRPPDGSLPWASPPCRHAGSVPDQGHRALRSISVVAGRIAEGSRRLALSPMPSSCVGQKRSRLRANTTHNAVGTI
jgi:hypothetical protein